MFCCIQNNACKASLISCDIVNWALVRKTKILIFWYMKRTWNLNRNNKSFRYYASISACIRNFSKAWSYYKRLFERLLCEEYSNQITSVHFKGTRSRSSASLSLVLFISVARKLIFTVYHASITAVIFNAIITLRHTRNPVNGSHFSNYRFHRTTILPENEQNYEDDWTKEALLKVCCLKGGEFSFTLCKYRRRW